MDVKEKQELYNEAHGEALKLFKKAIALGNGAIDARDVELATKCVDLAASVLTLTESR